jgi:Flp pilus assembly protein TadD
MGNDRALQIQPDDPDVWDGQGIALLHLDRYPEACQSFQQALALGHPLAQAHLDRLNGLQKS